MSDERRHREGEQLPGVFQAMKGLVIVAKCLRKLDAWLCVGHRVSQVVEEARWIQQSLQTN